MIVDTSEFKLLGHPPAQPEVYLVVKSLDQRERRKRLLQQKKGGRIGRIRPRPVAEGLLACATLTDSGVRARWTRSFREPRHLYPVGDGCYLLSEISRILSVDANGNVEDVYTHPWFSFLHTVQLSPDRRRILVAASGFDMVIELERGSGRETWRWSAWDHGFDKDSAGVRLTASRQRYHELVAHGAPAALIAPEDYGEQGLVTSHRSAHPNMAVYEDAAARCILFSIARSGRLYRHDRQTGESECVVDFLHQMPHGLHRIADGWLVTDTTAGSVYELDDGFRPLKRIDLFRLDGKVPDAGDAEWVQTAVKLGAASYLIADANRGLVWIDVEKRTRFTWQPDPDWCIQDLLPVEAR